MSLAFCYIPPTPRFAQFSNASSKLRSRCFILYAPQGLFTSVSGYSYTTPMVWPLSLLSGGSDAELSQETDKTDLDQQPSSPVKELLRHFESPSLSLPPSSRVGDPKLKQRESQPIRVWHLWKYGAFAAMKGECSVVLCTRPCRRLPLSHLCSSLTITSQRRN